MTTPERSFSPLRAATPLHHEAPRPRPSFAIARLIVALLLTAPVYACGGSSATTSASASASVGTSRSASGEPDAGAAEREAGPRERAARPPTSARPDTDGDGVPDALDRCVHDRGEAVAGGCPAYDADGDGTPEAWSQFSCRASACSQAYCVREAPAMPVLYFPRGRAAGRSGDIPALAAALGAEGDAYISGHTSEGEPAALGRERAEWVIARLAQRGVDTGRLQAVGFGSHWGKVNPPEGMSATDADRRVEVHAAWYGPPGCTEHEVPADKCPVACTP